MQDVLAKQRLGHIVYQSEELLQRRQHHTRNLPASCSSQNGSTSRNICALRLSIISKGAATGSNVLCLHTL